MRSIFPLLGIVLLIGGISGNSSIGSIYAQTHISGTNCEEEMAAETAAYIQSAGITINGSDTRFYSDADTRVYLLSSEEKVGMRSFTPFTNTFAVINFKEQGGKSTFLVLEQEIAADHINYSVRQGTQIIATATAARPSAAPTIPDIPQPWPPPVSPRCLYLASQIEKATAAAQVRANSTCQTQMFCLEMCIPPLNSPLYTVWAMFVVKPNSRYCFINVRPNNTMYNWTLNVPFKPLVLQATETAVDRETRLYY